MKEIFAKNLKYIRTSKRLSQQDLADMSGLDRSTITRYENGETEPTVGSAIQLSNALNIPLEDFLSLDFQSDNYGYDELEVLFNKNKDILTDDDKRVIRFILEQRKKEIDSQDM